MGTEVKEEQWRALCNAGSEFPDIKAQANKLLGRMREVFGDSDTAGGGLKLSSTGDDEHFRWLVVSPLGNATLLLIPGVRAPIPTQPDNFQLVGRVIALSAAPDDLRQPPPQVPLAWELIIPRSSTASVVFGDQVTSLNGAVLGSTYMDALYTAGMYLHYAIANHVIR